MKIIDKDTALTDSDRKELAAIIESTDKKLRAMMQPKTTCRIPDRVRRAAARALKRLREETVLRPLGPVCIEEWRSCRDVIAQEMMRVLRKR